MAIIAFYVSLHTKYKKAQSLFFKQNKRKKRKVKL